MLAGFEGFRSEPYQDVGGVWTNGFGNTRNVDKRRAVSVESALFTLRDNVSVAEAAINECVHVELSQGQFDALVSLAYNVGNSAVCNSNTVRYFNLGEYKKGCDAILTWDKVRINGHLVSCVDKRYNCYGIVKRRQQEHTACTTY